MQPVRTRRKNKFNFVKEAERLQSFDEFPMLRPEIDPQLHLSRNSVDQPFFLRCAKDSVIAQPMGASRIEFADGPTRYFDTEPGDYVYIPAGYTHRVLTSSPGILVRYKAREPGSETVLWLCPNCGQEIGRHEIDGDTGPVQAGYADACDTFNGSPAARTCTACSLEMQPIDLSPFRWREVAHAIVEAEGDSAVEAE
ncbi:hypothetical protein P1X14_10110 [Sphingomonas sp. AOB5]|uniref:hypothetical protein n=1 Tax=Sphingomonas sp. AOB5 TaxID=3034017 RepID=UPI0023F801EF|nr:hypothetical protein [Sphingomonas sp. AOB5]MDF7775600.1 hypothetical protein [Sphingomonas sp. AOB5]